MLRATDKPTFKLLIGASAGAPLSAAYPTCRSYSWRRDAVFLSFGEFHGNSCVSLVVPHDIGRTITPHSPRRNAAFRLCAGLRITPGAATIEWEENGLPSYPCDLYCPPPRMRELALQHARDAAGRGTFSVWRDKCPWTKTRFLVFYWMRPNKAWP